MTPIVHSLERRRAALAASVLATCAFVAGQAIWITNASAADAPSQQCQAEARSAQKTAGNNFWAHVKYAHLQTSPGQQAQDLSNVDDYTKLHTVWIDSMASPTVDTLTGPDC